MTSLKSPRIPRAFKFVTSEEDQYCQMCLAQAPSPGGRPIPTHQDEASLLMTKVSERPHRLLRQKTQLLPPERLMISCQDMLTLHLISQTCHQRNRLCRTTRTRGKLLWREQPSPHQKELWLSKDLSKAEPHRHGILMTWQQTQVLFLCLIRIQILPRASNQILRASI